MYIGNMKVKGEIMKIKELKELNDLDINSRQGLLMLRKAFNVHQTEAAEALGIALQTLIDIERNRIELSDTEGRKMIAALIEHIKTKRTNASPV